MKTAVLLCLIIAFGTAAANADWYPVSSGTDQDLNAIGKTDDFGRTLAVGNNGTIIFSPNHGHAWEPRQSPVSVNWRAIRRTNWVGGYRWLFIAGDDGQVWGVLISDIQNGDPIAWENLSLPTSADINGFFGDASGYLWVVCEDGTVWRKYNYNPWVQEPVPPDTPALNAGKGGFGTGGATLVVGDNGTILRRASYGDPFERIESGVTVDLYGVTGGHGNPFRVVGDQGTILRSNEINDGLTWTLEPTCTEQCLYYLTLDRAGGASGTYLLHDDASGQPWCLLPLPTTADMYSMVTFGYITRVVVGAGGLIFRIGDDRLPCTCDPIGACCLDEVCERLPESQCVSAGGVWHGAETLCDPSPCNPPVCLVSPTILDFGTVTIGESSDLTFTVINIGGGTLEGSVGVAAAPYSVISGGGSYALGADESVVVTVHFEPTAAGPFAETITTGGADVTCTGVGELAPQVAVEPTALDFGTVMIGESADLTFTVTNVGGGTLGGSVGDAVAPYSVISGGGPYVLGADESVTVTVHFEPTAEGLFEATITTGGVVVSCTGVAQRPVFTVSGTVSSDCAGPLLGVTVDLDVGDDMFTTTTDENGAYVLTDVPYSTCQDDNISIVIPLGFEAGDPPDGGKLVTLDQSQIVNFTVTCLDPTGEARSMGYWKHQANVYLKNKGHAHESEADMTTNFPNAIFNHFYENEYNEIQVEGVTFIMEPDPEDPSVMIHVPITLETMQTTLTVRGNQPMVTRAKQQYMAFLLNMASGKLQSQSEISEDGGVASQALQQVATYIGDGDPFNDEVAKDIADAINNAELVPTGIIDLTIEIIYYREDVPYAQLPTVTMFSGMAPSPFREATMVRFQLNEPSPVTVRVYSAAGRLVRELVNEVQTAGYHAVAWDGRDDHGRPLAQGVFYVLFETNGYRAVKRAVLLK